VRQWPFIAALYERYVHEELALLAACRVTRLCVRALPPVQVWCARVCQCDMCAVGGDDRACCDRMRARVLCCEVRARVRSVCG
jgi:hypothetical protein